MSFYFSFLCLITLFGWGQTPPAFRLSLFSEPASLSVYDQKTSSSAYLLSQLHSPLLWYHQQKLQPRLARCEQENTLKINCHFFENARFSNGESILPSHFQQMVLDYLNPQKPGQRADLLLPIKNAEKILSGKLKPEKIGLRIAGLTLTILLEKPNSDFIYNLANPLLSPQFHSRANFPKDSTQIVASGPYAILKWEMKNKITLQPNSFFSRTEKNPPALEFYFITEDSVALSLYERNELDLLRRLPTLYLSKYKNRSDFHFIDQFRFDYVGLGPELKSNRELRKKIISNLNYDELQKLFDSRPRPGCIGIPINLYQKPSCVDYHKEKKSVSHSNKIKLEYIFSKQGGDDHQRAAEWVQSEWKKNLNLNVELKSLENKLFLQVLQKKPPALFRKGLAPDRPTCLSVFENFLPQSPENFLKINDRKIISLVQKMRFESNPEILKVHCQSAIDQLLSKNTLIPMGPISFALLVRPEFRNWKLNDLNHLDLSELSYHK